MFHNGKMGVCYQLQKSLKTCKNNLCYLFRWNKYWTVSDEIRFVTSKKSGPYRKFYVNI